MSITPSITLGSLNLTAAPFLWEFGSDFGGPEVVYETLLSMLRDGSSISSNRFDNRTFTLQVMMEATNFLQLAQYEALLIAECDKERNTLTFVPGDAFGPSTVFDTFRVQATLLRNDDEEQAFVRRWSLAMTAAPAGKSAAVTVVPAVTTSVTTVVDTGSSTTGWTAPLGGSLSVVAGAVRLTWTTGTGTFGVGPVSLVRTGAVVPGVAQYLAIDRTSSVALDVERVLLDGVESRRAAVTDLGSGKFRHFYPVHPFGSVPSGNFSVLTISVGKHSTASSTYDVDQIVLYDALPFIGSAKQLLRSFTPGGSVRTQGSLAVEHATNALGSTLVFTYPSGLGWVPPLRGWLTSSSGVSADATAVSGSSQPLTATSVYRTPASILPAGSFIVMARMKVASAATVVVHFDAGTFIGSTMVGLVQNSASIPLTTAYQVVTLGRVNLPSTRIGPAGFAELDIYRDGASTVTLDEVWLFHESGDLTYVEAGTAAVGVGSSANRVWIDAPSLDAPQGAIWGGFSVDRSDAGIMGPNCLARPPYGHNLLPAGMNVFTVTSNADNAAVSSTHYKRWHTNAAE